MVAFDQGFRAAVDMVVRGADVEQLVSATGVVAREWEDTEPTFDEPTQVDQATFIDDVRFSGSIDV